VSVTKEELPMAVIEGFNHVAVITTDLDRKARFYADIFGLELVNVGRLPVEPRLRSGHLVVGAGCVLHVVENPDAGTMFPGQIGRRGPLDHFGLRVESRHALDEVRGRLVEAGASDGTITDFGDVLSVFFRDYDGMECEVGWSKTSAPASQ